MSDTIYSNSYSLNIIPLQFHRLSSLKCSDSELILKRRIFLANNGTGGWLNTRTALNTKLNL